MTMLTDLHDFPESERNAVCAELARMLRVVPINLSPATVAAPPGGVATPSLPVAVVGDSSLEGASL